MQEFGYKGESYSELIKRLLESAKQRQLHDLLMNEENTISIEEALANARKQWQK
jgi:predicted CopG family antitoxin